MLNKKEKIKVLFVCMGNICRSPTAEGVFQNLLEREGFADFIEVDSAGTHAYHVGEPPDLRSQQAARSRGVDLSEQRARRVCKEDFGRFDLVLAMDRENLRILEQTCPIEHRDRVKLFLDYAFTTSKADVPDPYYGGGHGFEIVLDLVEEASQGLLASLRN